LTFRQDNAGLYQEVYQFPTVWSPRLRSDLNNFARTWLKNISDTPYVKDYAITERNGDDIRIDFDNKGNPIPETPQEEASPEQEAAAPESVQEMESPAPEQVSETITESAAQEIETPSNGDSVPQDKPAYQGVPLEFLPYKKGDTVYLWRMSFQVHEIGVDYVELSNPISGGSRKFHYHKENRAKFEQELLKDERNRAIFDFLPANPEDVGAELTAALVSGSGLLQARDKEAISGVLRDGKSNSEIARMMNVYAGVWNSIRMANGEQAEFSGTLNGLYVNILGQNGRSLSFDWNTVVSVLRGMWQRGEFGFSVEPKAPETAKDNPIETLPERNANSPERAETVTENAPPVIKEASAPETVSADAPKAESDGAKSETPQSEATEATPSKGNAEDIPIGATVTIDGHRMRVDKVNPARNEAELLDLDSPRGMLPMFLIRNVDFVRKLLAAQTPRRTENVMPDASAPPPVEVKASDASATLNAERYLELKARYPDKIVGVQLEGKTYFYGKDAETVAPFMNHPLEKREIPGLGETSVTASPFGWAWGFVQILEHGHNALIVSPDEEKGPDAPYVIMKERDAFEHIPIGQEVTLDGRRMKIDRVDYKIGEVSLQDMETYYPIFRPVDINTARELVEEAQDRELKEQARKEELDAFLLTVSEAEFNEEVDLSSLKGRRKPEKRDEGQIAISDLPPVEETKTPAPDAPDAQSKPDAPDAPETVPVAETVEIDGGQLMESAAELRRRRAAEREVRDRAFPSEIII
ncbi:MAG: hypothetical protein J6X53_05665, partial [Abditibacteriota bacterium]|nr:hypothetical protein [Abditibacteriota bacterium]